MKLKQKNPTKFRPKLWLLLLLLPFSILMSCGDDDDDDDNNSDTAKASISFILDGKEITLDFINLAILSKDQREQLTIVGNDDANAKEVITLIIIDEEEVREVAYETIIDSNNALRAFITYIVFSEDRKSATTYSTNSLTSDGNITITEFNRDKKSVSGTFNATMTVTEAEVDDPENFTSLGEMTITNGVFKNIKFRQQ